VTNGAFKELGDMINERKGKIPIFGYPLLCFSPHHEGEDQFIITYDPQKHSRWIPMLNSIQNGSKKDHQLLIKDLLESHDNMKEQ